MKYLDKTGLQYYDEKIKTYINDVASGNKEQVLVMPKNFLNPNHDELTWQFGKTFKPNGEETDSTSYGAQYYAISDYIEVEGGKIIVASRDKTSSTRQNLAYNIVEYDSNKNFVKINNSSSGLVESSSPPTAVTLSSGTKYIRFSANKTYIGEVTGISKAMTTTYHCQLEYVENSTDTGTAYEDYFTPYYKTIEKDTGDAWSGEIVCWGDSLTHGTGATSGNTYPERLAVLTNKVVHKCGFPGDNSMEILGYANAAPLIAKPCTIPASGSVNIDIYQYDLFGGYSLGYPNVENIEYPFRFPSTIKNYINPVTIAGIEGDLTLNQSGNTTTRTFTFTRKTSGNAVTLTHDTPIMTKNGEDRRNDIQIIWIGTNGGWYNHDNAQYEDQNYTDRLIQQIKTLIEYQNASKHRYIVIGFSTGTDATRNIADTIFANAFGIHFINPRYYLSRYGMAEAGLTVESGSQDETDISAGRVPVSLRSDGTHFNDYGYQILANLIYERGKLLGYWD